MAGIELDLNTTILTDEHRVFVARPGKDYRLFNEFIASNSILLELPSLDLTQAKQIEAYNDLLPRILRARAIRNWHRRGTPEKDAPSRDLRDYAGARSDASAAQLQGIVKNLFGRAQKRDLVIVPPKSFVGDAYIGEFVDDGTMPTKDKVRQYPGEVLNGRRVSWLTQIPKRELPISLINALQKPNAFFLLERSLRSEIYENVYSSYVIDGSYFSSRFDVSAADFTIRDDFLIQAFFNFVAANTKFVSIGEDIKVDAITKVAFLEIGDYAPDLRTNINSPGSLGIMSRYVTPLVAAALFALAVDFGADAGVCAEAGTLVMTNSKSNDPNDVCTAIVHTQVIKQLQLLGLDKWPEACEKIKEAAASTGMTGPVKVKKR